MSIGPFDIVRSAGESKVDLRVEHGAEFRKAYNPWLVNRAFSYSGDSVFYANEMNRLDASVDMQYDFYLYALPKRKRRGRWDKPVKHDELIREVYQFNDQRIREMVDVLTDEQVECFRSRYTKGGKE